ncbi:MAG: condensation domain-containing protein, partial [Acidobacteriota bacterium]
TSVAYSLPWVLELRGPLDIDALSRSLDAILERHPPLRMRIVEVDGEPRMRSRRVAPLALDPLVLDAAGDLDAAIRAEIARPLDLTTGPTVRFRLVRIAEDHHALVWTAHHIAYDLSSYNVTLAELEVLYPRLLGGREIDTSPLDPLEITYGDHVRRLLDRSSGAAEHWERALAEVDALDWPLDRPRPAWPNHPAAIAVRRVDAASTDALRQLARSRGRSTVFPPTLAAFAVLLRGLTTQSDLLIGVPVAGRDDPDVRPLIGFFVDVLAVRLDVGDGEIGFADLIDRAHEAFLEAYRHPQPPSLNHLVDELARNRQVGANPFFPVTFQLAREPGVPELPGLDVTQSRLRADHAKFDLRMDVYDRRDHLSLEIEYDTELFDPATIERWLDLYVSVLEQAVADPRRPIAKLSLVTDGDRAVIERANDNASTIPGDLPLIEQVRRHVRATPDKTAVVDGERRWTWGTLGSRVDQLAAHLGEIGVRPGDFVGLCVERGAELPLGMLGILAAGGAYAALDPSYPDDRLRFMIDDAGLTVLVVQRHLVDHLPEVDGVTHLVVDELLDPRSRTDRLDEPSLGESTAHGSFDGDFPACLIYTSGSTGTPKASVLPQRGVTRLVVGTQYTTFTDEDVFTQTASPSFDAATFEVWGALLNGGTLVVVDRDDLLSPDAFGETLRREGATVVFLTTAYFQQIARRAPEVLATPRAVF